MYAGFTPPQARTILEPVGRFARQRAAAGPSRASELREEADAQSSAMGAKCRKELATVEETKERLARKRPAASAIDLTASDDEVEWTGKADVKAEQHAHACSSSTAGASSEHAELVD